MSDNFPFIKDRPIDLIAMGRVTVDLYAEQFGSPLKDVQTFRKYIGGCAGKVAIGTSRLGLKSSLLSCVSMDAMGQYVQQVLEKENVDCRLLSESNDHLTGLNLVAVNSTDHNSLIMYREKAADMEIKPEHCLKKVFEQAKALLITGAGLSTESLRKTTQYAVNLAKDCKVGVVLDLQFLDSEKLVTQNYQFILAKCDVIVGTENEITIAGGDNDIHAALKSIRKLTQAVIVVKTVQRGCEIYVGDNTISLGFPGFAVEPLNAFGVGEAFLSGLLRGCLRGEKWKTSAQYATAASAIIATRTDYISAMPSFEELEYFIRHFRSNDQIIHDPHFNQLHVRTLHRHEHKKNLTILSFDHRWQFEQSCEEVGRDRNLISAFKSQVFSGFKEVFQQFPDKELGILIDPIYGKDVLREATEMKINIGVPIEAAGSFPLQWLSEQPLYQQLLRRPESWIVKVLWKYHPSMETGLKLRQLSQLQLLYSVCRGLDRRLMVEIAIPSSFSADGKEIAHAIEEVYQHRIYPMWWKIVPVKSQSEWQAITDMCFYYDPTSKIIISSGISSVNQDWAKQFKQFGRSKLAAGFAVGRNMYWDSWQLVLSGELALEDVPQRVAEKFSAMIGTWEELETVELA